MRRHRRDEERWVWGRRRPGRGQLSFSSGARQLKSTKAIADAKGSAPFNWSEHYRTFSKFPQATEGVSCYTLHDCYAMGMIDPVYSELNLGFQIEENVCERKGAGPCCRVLLIWTIMLLPPLNMTVVSISSPGLTQRHIERSPPAPGFCHIK